MSLPHEVCDRCGCRGEVVHVGSDVYCPGHTTDYALAVEIERLRTVMTAVASMPGKEWLTGQLALGEALQSGGSNLDYVMALVAEAGLWDDDGDRADDHEKPPSDLEIRATCRKLGMKSGPMV